MARPARTSSSRIAAIIATMLIVPLLFVLAHASVASANDEVVPPGKVLAMLAIAYDINPASRRNLSAEYQSTIDRLVHATTQNKSLTVMALVDMPGPANTFVLRVEDGLVHQYSQLPAPSGVMTTSIREFDMGDGAALGGFILWARQSVSAERSIFSFIGHGGPVIPADVDFARILDQAAGDGSQPPASSGGIFVWPSHINANPDVTDWYNKSIITPHDLRIALETGTTNDLGTIDVADLVHCFAGTIEELYELGDYAKMVTASPNYTFYTASMPGLALEHINVGMSPAAIADALLASYHDTLPNDGYPRVMVAVDSSQLPAIKTAWDTLSNNLLNAPIDIDIKHELGSAYLASAKYEATVLEPANWTLEAPDALVDMADFASNLRGRFGSTSDIGRQARETMLALDSAVIARYECEGQPDHSYAPNWPKQSTEYGCDGMPEAPWTFADHPGSGISLFSPLAVEVIDGEKYGPWQALWYDKARDASDDRGPTITNSLSFIEGSQLTWSDVISDYWEGETIKTMFSLPAFAPVRERGEISAELILPSPDRPNAVDVGHPMYPRIALNTARIANGPLIDIEIAQGGSVVYSSTFSTGYLITGTHPIVAKTAWTPTMTGTYTISITLDSDDRIIEQNEGDNLLTMTGSVIETTVRPDVAFVFDGDIISETRPITTDVVPVVQVDRLWLRVYQFESDIADSPILSPTVRWSGMLEFNGSDFDFSPDLFDLEPGAVEVHIWSGTTADGIQSVEPRILRFNYNQRNTLIETDEQHVYWTRLKRGEQFAAKIETSAELNFYIWHQWNHWQPNQAFVVNGTHTSNLTAPFSGTYLIGVENVGCTDEVCIAQTLAVPHYTLFMDKHASLERAATGTPIVPADRPVHRPELINPSGEPDSAWSSVPTVVGQVEMGLGFRPNALLLLTTIILTITTLSVGASARCALLSTKTRR